MFQSLASQPVSNLGQCCLFTFRKQQPTLELTSEHPVLCRQILGRQQEFLIDHSTDVGQHARPDHSRAPLKLIFEPGLYLLLRFQKAVVRGNYDTENRAFSMRLRFVTIRENLTEKMRQLAVNRQMS